MEARPADPAVDPQDNELAAVFSPSIAAADSKFSPPLAESDEDSIATKEAVALANERDIEKDGKEQEHDRHQAFRNHVNIATLFLFWVLVFCIFVGILTFTWHLITPESWHYLAQAQLEKLQTMLGAAVLSSALTGYVKQRMD